MIRIIQIGSPQDFADLICSKVRVLNEPENFMNEHFIEWKDFGITLSNDNNRNT